jgi:hypothetical protein
MRTPGDFLGWGVAVILFGCAFVALLAAVTETTELLWLAIAPAVVGGVLLQIGIVAWGVHVGVRTATARQDS